MLIRELEQFRDEVALPRMLELFAKTEIPEGTCFIDNMNFHFFDGRSVGVETCFQASGLLYRDGKVEKYDYEEYDDTLQNFLSAHKDCILLSEGVLEVGDDISEMKLSTVICNISQCGKLFPDLANLPELNIQSISIAYEKMKHLLQEQPAAPSVLTKTFEAPEASQAMYLLDNAQYLHLDYNPSSGIWDCSLYDAKTLDLVESGFVDAPDATAEGVKNVFLRDLAIEPDQITLLSDIAASALCNIFKSVPTPAHFDAVNERAVEEQNSSLLNMDTSGLKVAGHVGTWHTIDHEEVEGQTFWLLEHDTYGDDAACIIVDSRGQLSLSNVYDGFDAHTIDLLRQEVMPVERMPDDTITVDEMKQYGYGWGGMLPMREATAAEVMKSCTVYRLYEDDTEGMVMDASDLKNHAAQGGIFGVEKVEWMASQGLQSQTHTAQGIKISLEDQIQSASGRATGVDSGPAVHDRDLNLGPGR